MDIHPVAVAESADPAADVMAVRIVRPHVDGDTEVSLYHVVLSLKFWSVCLEAGNLGHEAVVVCKSEGCFQVAAKTWLCGYVMGNEWSKTRITRND